jgi:hypothetical protein
VNGNTIYLIHLIELINAHDASVSQNHGTSLQTTIT